VARDLVGGEDRPRLDAAIAEAERWRDSWLLELAVAVFVLLIQPWVWRTQLALATDSWLVSRADGEVRWTAAGAWYAVVSLPVFQFLFFRWYARLFLWYRLLWRTTRLDLHLVPSHPDLAGGIGFVGTSTHAFAPLLLAHGVLLSAVIIDRVLFEGRTFASFQVETVGLVLVFLLLFLGPLLVFSPLMVRARRRGLGSYGELASAYAGAFHHTWIGQKMRDPQRLSGDLQGLADLGKSYGMVRGMRFVPFGPQTVTWLAASLVAPLLPLALAVVPLEAILERLVQTVL